MTEIEQLREEVAKLRERVAVLEARPAYFQAPQYLPPQPSWHPFTVTCDGRTAPTYGSGVMCTSMSQ